MAIACCFDSWTSCSGSVDSFAVGTGTKIVLVLVLVLVASCRSNIHQCFTTSNIYTLIVCVRWRCKSFSLREPTNQTNAEATTAFHACVAATVIIFS